MAIISSISLGKVRKSLGNVTLQHYYGKTVAKQKILRNPSYVPTTAQTKQRDRMKFAFQLMNTFDGLADLLFVRSKWGTKRNNFLKLNYPAFAAYFNDTESPIIPLQGNVVSLLWLMQSHMITYGVPCYVAKGRDAGVSAVWARGQYADGVTPVTLSLSITDALYTKIKVRLLSLFANTDVTPYTAQTPLKSSEWYDMTLQNGIWTMPATTISIAHTTIGNACVIAQIMIDDMPATINLQGTTLGGDGAFAFLQLPVQ